MKILGIDPGTATTGYGLVERTGGDGTEKLIEYGTIRTEAGTPMPQRLVELHEGLSGLIAELAPDAVAVEELFFARNVTTALSVGQARGVILLAAAQSGVPVYEYRDERDHLERWAERKSDEELAAYLVEKNAKSLDGLPGISTR